MKVAHLAKRNLLRHLSGTIRNIIAISIPSIILMLLFGFMGAMDKDLQTAITKYLAGEVRIQNKLYGENEIFNPTYFLIEDVEAVLEKVSEIEEVGSISQKLYVPVTVQKEDVLESLMLLGVDFDLEDRYNGFKSFVIEGRLPADGKREALLGQETADSFAYKIGDQITFLGGTALRGQNGMSVTVVGILKYPSSELNKNKMVVSLDIGQRFFKSPNAVSEVDIRAKDTSNISASQLAKKIDAKLLDINTDIIFAVDQWKDISGLYVLVAAGRVVYLFIGIIFIFLGSLIIYNAIYLSLYSRRYELGVLNAMGVDNYTLRRMFRIEVLTIVIIGSILGIVIGGSLVSLMGHFGINLRYLGTNTDGTLLSNIQYPRVGAFWTSILFIYSVVLSFLVGSFPIRMLKKETVLSLLKSDS